MLAPLLLLAQNRPSPEWQPLLEAPKNLTNVCRIAPNAHAGSPMEIKGRVLRSDGRTPIAGTVLYFHHTDGRGDYPRPAGARPTEWVYWHGSLRGWLKTDSQGNYVLKSTRPAQYPGDSTEPAHIHVTALLPGSREGIFFNDILFHGDSKANADYWRRMARVGVTRYDGIKLTRRHDGVLTGNWDFVVKP